MRIIPKKGNRLPAWYFPHVTPPVTFFFPLVPLYSLPHPFFPSPTASFSSLLKNHQMATEILGSHVSRYLSLPPPHFKLGCLFKCGYCFGTKGVNSPLMVCLLGYFLQPPISRGFLCFLICTKEVMFRIRYIDSLKEALR